MTARIWWSLTIAIISFDLIASQPTVMLNEHQRAYIKANPTINMCLDPDWRPFEYLDENGQHQGIGADLIRLAAQRVGLRLEPLQINSWPESIAASQAGECQVLSFINQTPAREDWLIFTDPLLEDSNVIITRQDQLFIPNLATLRNKTLVLPKGTSIEERIRHDYPNIAIALVETEQQSFEMVNDGRADLTLRSLSVAAYTIRKQGYFNLKISGQVPEYNNQLRMGIAKDNKILRDILNQGVATLTDHEREQITNKHIYIQVENQANYRLIWQIITISLLILLVSWFWIHWLIKLNRKLIKVSMRDPSTGLINAEGIHLRIEQEIERTKYSQKTFGIMIIAIEHSPLVNKKQLQIRNTQLIELSAVIKNHTQIIDTLGLWSNEELILICPYINLSKLQDQLEILENEINEINLSNTHKVNTYIGATIYIRHEDKHTFISRAEQALYFSIVSNKNMTSIL
jgi:ABC-type amino acid transport substrate-binding protein/GGDEF domain-containing protein